MQISASDNEFYSVFKKILEDITLNNKGKKLNETDQFILITKSLVEKIDEEYQH